MAQKTRNYCAAFKLLVRRWHCLVGGKSKAGYETVSLISDCSRSTRQQWITIPLANEIHESVQSPLPICVLFEVYLHFRSLSNLIGYCYAGSVSSWWGPPHLQISERVQHGDLLASHLLSLESHLYFNEVKQSANDEKILLAFNLDDGTAIGMYETFGSLLRKPKYECTRERLYILNLSNCQYGGSRH